MAVLLWVAPAAQAHPTLLFTTPAADTAVAESPTSITLLFNEPVTLGENALTISDAVGVTQPVGPVATSRDGSAVIATLRGDLAPQTYMVRWRVTGADGDVVEDEFRFAVGVALAGSGAASAGPGISWFPAVLRWVLFAGLAVTLGGLIAQRVTATARLENPSLVAVRSWAPFGVLAGLAAVGGLAVQLVGGSGWSVLWADRPGQLLAVEAAGFAGALVLIAVHRAGWAALPLLAVAAAEGVRSHAGVTEPGWGALLTAVHLAAAAVWAGALLHTVRAAAAWRAHHGAVRWVFAEHARFALWLFLLVVATGTLTAVLLAPATALTTTSYGQVLLLKIALVTAAAGLALAARLSLRRPGRLRRLAGAESTVLVAVLAVAATLVSTPLPRSSEQSAPAPPAPAGVVLPLGARAGQVGVSLTASEGQLVVRLATPRHGDYYEPAAAQRYQLSGRLRPAGRAAERLRFRPCGEGCFVSAVRWGVGDNPLTLRVAAAGWRGGAVGALVPWPVQTGSDLLARTVETMRQASAFTLYEVVTSDTSAPPSEPRPLRPPIDVFLSAVPYASGVAPVAARVSREGEPVRLALGFPAAGQTALLVIDDRGRIAEETLTSEKHLVRHRFVYTE
ncbi:MAG: copper resistance protein CopC [Pseudonocardiaceae bacterium]|nr:copper resistance protein CopC [Pseudonocardiaceae bacterium]